MTNMTTGPVPTAFNEETLKAYIVSQPHLFALFKNDLSTVQIDEIGDGNLNFVFFVSGNGAALALKQALPYSRISGGKRALTCERLAFETAALREFARLAPQFVPIVHHFDPEQSLLALEFLSPHIIMRKGMIDGIEYPLFADHISTYLANCLYGTSDFALSASKKREMVAYYARNIELCEITERLIFTEPFMDSVNNQWTSPALDGVVAKLQSDVELKIRVGALKHKFLTQSEALLHADLHSGSVMLTSLDTKVIDPEFAIFGPMGFDIGILIGNLLLNYFAQEAYKATGDGRATYRQHILETIEAIWTGFSKKINELWQNNRTGDAYSSAVFDSNDPAIRSAMDNVIASYLEGVFHDTLGYAAVEMIRRTIGRAHTIDFDMIDDKDIRSRCELKVLSFAKTVLKKEKEFRIMVDLTKLAKLQN